MVAAVPSPLATTALPNQMTTNNVRSLGLGVCPAPATLGDCNSVTMLKRLLSPRPTKRPLLARGNGIGTSAASCKAGTNRTFLCACTRSYLLYQVSNPQSELMSHDSSPSRGTQKLCSLSAVGSWVHFPASFLGSTSRGFQVRGTAGSPEFAIQ